MPTPGPDRTASGPAPARQAVGDRQVEAGLNPGRAQHHAVFGDQLQAAAGEARQRHRLALLDRDFDSVAGS